MVLEIRNQKFEKFTENQQTSINRPHLSYKLSYEILILRLYFTPFKRLSCTSAQFQQAKYLHERVGPSCLKKQTINSEHVNLINSEHVNLVNFEHAYVHLC